MKALKFFREKGLILVDIPKPSIKEGEVLVKVESCAICGSDARILKGEKEVKEGITLGHEISGVIAESLHPEYKPKEKVVIFPSIFCKECESCKAGFYNLCLNKRSLGYMLDGGFAEFVKIPKELVQLKALIKTSISEPTIACLTEPFACVINSFKIMSIQKNQTLLIIGAGPLGLMHVIMGKLKNLRIFIVDPNEKRLEVAKNIMSNIETFNSLDELEKKRITFDAISLCVFVPQIISRLCFLLKPKGVLNIFAGGRWEEKALFIPNEIHYKEKIITGTHSTTLDMFRESERLIRQNQKMFKKLITHKFPLENYKEAFETYIKRKGLKVVFCP